VTATKVSNAVTRDGGCEAAFPGEVLVEDRGVKSAALTARERART
jgi:hypothetical protein